MVLIKRHYEINKEMFNSLHLIRHYVYFALLWCLFCHQWCVFSSSVWRKTISGKCVCLPISITRRTDPDIFSITGTKLCVLARRQRSVKGKLVLSGLGQWILELLLERDQSAYTVKQRQYCWCSSFQSRTWVSWWRRNSVLLAESLSFSPNWPSICFIQITELFSFVLSETKYVMNIWKTELKPRFESHVSCYGDYLWLDKGTCVKN